MTLTPEEVELHTGEIAAKLGETEEGPLRQVRMIVEHAGVEFALAMLKDTLEIEAMGGMLTADGLRRRSPGGVYFYVAKGKLEPSLRQIIFPGFGQTLKGASIEWDMRQTLTEPLLSERLFGYMTTAPRITLHGRSRAIQKNENSYLMMLETTLEPVSYGRGIPTPPKDPTVYAIYMGKGQYDRIEKTLRRNPKDSIIIEGTCMWDAATGTIAVFALTVSTRFLEKKTRQDEMQPALTGKDDETAVILPGKPIVAPNPKKAEKAQKQAKEAAHIARVIKASAPKDAPKAPEKPAPQPAQPKTVLPTQPQTAQPNAPKQPDAPKQPAPKPQKAAQQPKPIEFVPAPPRPIEPVDRLTQLEQAARTLRERISVLESKKQPGVAMTRKLLENTEREIAVLRKR